MRGTTKQLPMYSKPVFNSIPSIDFCEFLSFTQKGSDSYPVMMVSTREWSVCIVSIVATGQEEASLTESGRRESASATVLASPEIYWIWWSYCAKNSCQRACRCERSF